jgi:uncharacterized YigZ family protein
MITKSNDSDIYYSIEARERQELKVKGSRFIATVSPANSKWEAIAFIDTIKAEFFDATHNCWAYRIGFDGLEYRSSDDGEPSGSAGKPILFAIQKHDLTDIVVVVTRYFGGTKLGIGPLARAYSDSASSVLNLCTKKPVYRTITLKIFCTYEDYQTVKKIVIRDAIEFKESFQDAVEIIADIPISKSEIFAQEIQDQTSGRAGTVIFKN